MKKLLLGAMGISLIASALFAVSDSKVEVKKALILNQTTMVGSKNSGNAGIEVKGKKVKIEKALLLNKTTMVGSKNSGNAGVNLENKKGRFLPPFVFYRI